MKQTCKKTQPFFIPKADKVSINFSNKTFDFRAETDFEIIPDYSPHDKTFKYSFRVYYKNKLFGYIYHENRLHTTESQFKIDNKMFYTCPNWGDLMDLFIFQYQIVRWSFSKNEICFDTNIPLLANWYNYFKINKRSGTNKSSDLKIKPGHYDIAIMSSVNRANNVNHNTDTILLKKQNSAVTTRIENKSNEIAVKISRKERDKTYILDCHSTLLDLNQPIYRIEICINYPKLVSSNKSQCYSLIKNSFITINKTEYNKLSKYKKAQYHLVDKMLPKNFPFQLLQDPEFLISMFDRFVTFDYKKVLGIIRVKPLGVYIIKPVEYKEIIETVYVQKYGQPAAREKQTRMIKCDVSYDSVFGMSQPKDYDSVFGCTEAECEAILDKERKMCSTKNLFDRD